MVIIDKKEYRHNYYEVNKEKWKIKKTCECGGRYTSNSRANHFKTKKHLKYEEEQKINNDNKKTINENMLIHVFIELMKYNFKKNGSGENNIADDQLYTLIQQVFKK